MLNMTGIRISKRAQQNVIAECKHCLLCSTPSSLDPLVVFPRRGQSESDRPLEVLVVRVDLWHTNAYIHRHTAHIQTHTHTHTKTQTHTHTQTNTHTSTHLGSAIWQSASCWVTVPGMLVVLFQSIVNAKQTSWEYMTGCGYEKYI